MLSVVLLTRGDVDLGPVRARVARARGSVETILVLPPGARASVGSVTAARAGRGHQMVAGIRRASNDTVLVLHDDTLLPPGWDDAVHAALRDPRVVGGAFSLAFDRPHPFLDVLERLTRGLHRVHGELWGDRGIFFRRHLVLPHLQALDVPLFEDVRLSRLLARAGRTVILAPSVVTSARAFRVRGLVPHASRILVCRAAYALGASPERIHAWYERQESTTLRQRRRGASPGMVSRPP